MSAVDRVNEDQVELLVDGKKLLIAESYDVKRTVFEQPSSFEVKLGSKSNVSDIAKDVKIGMDFALRVATDRKAGEPVQIMTGKIDAVDVSDAPGTVISIRGRDTLAPLVKASIRADETFAEATYGDLTRTVLDKLHMLDKYILVEKNVANLKAITGTDLIKETTGPYEYNDELRDLDKETDIRYGSTTLQTNFRRVRRTIRAQVGETWWSFLKRQYKKVGLFLWAAGEGSYVLSAPLLNQEPIARVFRANPDGDWGTTSEQTQNAQRSLSVDYTNRHARVRVWGRAGRRMGGRSKFEAHVDDLEMIERGYDPEIDVIEYHDADVKSNKEAEYVARRHLSEERRDSWRLVYRLSGHSTPALSGGGNCVWAPDTIVLVDDIELGYFDMQFYVTEVSFSRGSAGTTSTITLSRPEDLVFAEKEQAT